MRCAWVFASESSAAPERIVPDGRCELITHFGAPYAEVDADGKLHVQPVMLFAGQVTRPLTLQCAGPAGVVGVRFHPDGARAFLGRSVRETTNHRIPIDNLLPESGEMLERDIAAAHDDATRAALACEFVGRRIARISHEDDVRVHACVRRIEASSGTVTLEELLEEAGIGRRQLERRFSEAVGVGPALLASIIRFRGVFDVLERDGTRPWTEAALAAGYYDQSHFIREFRRFVGCAPSEFLRAGSELSAALIDA